MFQVDHKLTQVGSKTAQIVQVDSSRPQVQPKAVQVRPSWHELPLIWPQDGPSGWQDGHKYGQVDPEIDEVGTKRASVTTNLAQRLHIAKVYEDP